MMMLMILSNGQLFGITINRTAFGKNDRKLPLELFCWKVKNDIDYFVTGADFVKIGNACAKSTL